jgi:hypothetical protein
MNSTTLQIGLRIITIGHEVRVHTSSYNHILTSIRALRLGIRHTRPGVCSKYGTVDGVFAAHVMKKRRVARLKLNFLQESVRNENAAGE